MSPSTAHRVPIAGWTRSNALYQRVVGKSQCSQFSIRYPSRPPLSTAHPPSVVMRSRPLHRQSLAATYRAFNQSRPEHYQLRVSTLFWLSADVRRKWTKDEDHHAAEHSTTSLSNATRKLASRDALDSIQNLNSAASRRSHESEPRHDEHVPHSICA
jgi:hypothetical protein